MRTTALFLTLALALFGCSGAAESPDPITEIRGALAAAGGAETRQGITRLALRFEGRLLPPEGMGAATKFSGEWLLDRERGLATLVSTSGLVTRKALLPDGGWFRRGAAVADLPAMGLREERADRDDLLAILVSPLLSPPFRLSRGEDGTIEVARKGGDVFTLHLDPASGLPDRIDRVSLDESGKTYPLVRRLSDWTEIGGLLFPAQIVTELAGGSQELTVTALSVNPEASEATFTRPDDSGPGEAGEIRREKFASTNVVAIAQRGPLTDLASVDLFLERALERAKATRKGPLLRIFKEFPSGESPGVLLTMAAVDFSRDSAALGLPYGAHVELAPGLDHLVMPYTGPYPTSDEVYAPLFAKAEELGLVPVGRPWHAILSDPDAGAPNELRQEIRLPVKEKE